jgi:hypothetical protein
MGKKRINVDLDEIIWKRFKLMAVSLDKNMNQLLEEILTQEVTKFEKKKGK